MVNELESRTPLYGEAKADESVKVIENSKIDKKTVCFKIEFTIALADLGFMIPFTLGVFPALRVIREQIYGFVKM